MKEANRNYPCDFDIKFNEENWHIYSRWVDRTNRVVWYDGRIDRNGITFYRVFSPDEIDVPKVERVSE